MKRWLQDFLGDEAGISIMEYALVVALIGIVTAGVLVMLEEELCDVFRSIGNAPERCNP